jgi:hypothetical protein
MFRGLGGISGDGTETLGKGRFSRRLFLYLDVSSGIDGRLPKKLKEGD